MNQPESGRVTVEDIAWLSKSLDDAVWDEGASARIVRILNSLNPPAVPVADRERLARALYMLNAEATGEAQAATVWDEEAHVGVTFVKGLWRERADRLQRILGGFPVATEAVPFGWYVYRLTDGAGAFLFREPQESPATQTVTPLYAAPPVPVVQKEPFVWLARPRHGCDRLVWSREGLSALGSGWAVTPLYALETTDG